MELALSLAVLALCCPLLHAANGEELLSCVDIAPRQKSPVSAKYTSSRTVRGCLGPSPAEVHVLNVKNTQQMDIIELILELEAGVNPLHPDGKVRFVLYIEGYLKTSLLFPALLQNHLSIYLHSSSALSSNHQHLKVNKTELPSDSEELLRWAETQFEGITSFTELHSPLKIHFRVGVGILSTSDCLLQKDFNARSYMTSDYWPDKMKVCKVPEPQETKQAFMLQVHWDQDSQQTKLNVTVECSVGDNKEDLLILQSNNGQPWNITSNHNIKILASAPFSLNDLQNRELQDQIKVPHSLDELLVLSQDRGFHIASHMEVHSASHVTVTLHNCDMKSTKEPIATTDASSFGSNLAMLISLLQPWKCDQDSLEIVLAKQLLPSGPELIITGIILRDPQCRAEENDTHFYLTTSVKDCLTEVDHRQHVKNEMMIILTAPVAIIQVPFECIPQQTPSVEMRLSRSLEFIKLSNIIEANKIFYAQVFVNPATEESHLQLQECWLQPEGEQKRPLILQDSPNDAAVNILTTAKESPGMKTRQFSFIYRAEEGCLVQPANLKCLLCLQTREGCLHKNRFEKSLDVILTNSNSPQQVSGLGMVAVLSITFGAFLTGALLTAALWYIYSHTRPPAKLQPVPGNQAASESSSANHSIGSTQSTPCSTSSMA